MKNRFLFIAALMALGASACHKNDDAAEKVPAITQTKKYSGSVAHTHTLSVSTGSGYIADTNYASGVMLTFFNNDSLIIKMDCITNLTKVFPPPGYGAPYLSGTLGVFTQNIGKYISGDQTRVYTRDSISGSGSSGIHIAQTASLQMNGDSLSLTATYSNAGWSATVSDRYTFTGVLIK